MTNQADNRHWYLFLIVGDIEEEWWKIDSFTEIKVAKNFSSLQEAEKYQETNKEMFGNTDQDLEDDLSDFHGIETRAMFAGNVSGPYLFKSEVELHPEDLEDMFNNLSDSEVRAMLKEGRIKKGSKVTATKEQER